MSARIRAFNKTDIEALNLWREKRGLATLLYETLPFRGFIVPDVAAGFMYVADCRLAILEFYTTNPEAPLRSRYFALDHITSSLIEQARAIGCKHIKWDTHIKTFKRRFKDYGFKELGNYTVFMKEL